MAAVIALLLSALIVFGIVTIFAFPIIWALNTLFQLAIPYTWQTVLSVVVLSLVLGPSSRYIEKKKDS
jgi:hypothetical protein